MQDIVKPLPQTATVQSYISNRNYANTMHRPPQPKKVQAQDFLEV